MDVRRIIAKGYLFLLVVAFGAIPSKAQVNLSGVWNNRFDEDEPDRKGVQGDGERHPHGDFVGLVAGLPVEALEARARLWRCLVHLTMSGSVTIPSFSTPADRAAAITRRTAPYFTFSSA